MSEELQSSFLSDPGDEGLITDPEALQAAIREGTITWPRIWRCVSRMLDAKNDKGMEDWRTQQWAVDYVTRLVGANAPEKFMVTIEGDDMTPERMLTEVLALRAHLGPTGLEGQFEVLDESELAE